MKASTVFVGSSKLISLDDKKCKVGREQRSVPCATVKYCLEYSGTNLPTFMSIIYLFIQSFFC